MTSVIALGNFVVDVQNYSILQFSIKPVDSVYGIVGQFDDDYYSKSF